MDIVILDGYALNPGDLDYHIFDQFGKVTVYDQTPNDPAEIIKRIGSAEVVLTNKVSLDQQIMAAAPNLNYIGVMATGFNIIDLAAAKARGIVVTNIPAYSTEAVAQHTFALLLEITNHVGLHDQAVKAGEWTKSPLFTFWKVPLMELKGKTIGLVGYGHIGQKVAEIAHAFDLTVIYANHRPKKPRHDWAKQVSLAELYQTADIISLHLPETAENEKMINQAAINQMKDGVILLNTARGGLLDETAVAQALDQGKIGAFGADVVSVEPIKGDNPLLQAKNTILTPHIAWAPLETRERLLQIAVDNLRHFQQGTTINQVN